MSLSSCARQVEDSGLAGLALMTGLTALNLQECWQITTAGLAALSGGGPHCTLGLGSAGRCCREVLQLFTWASRPLKRHRGGDIQMLNTGGGLRQAQCTAPPVHFLSARLRSCLAFVHLGKSPDCILLVWVGLWGAPCDLMRPETWHAGPSLLLCLGVS